MNKKQRKRKMAQRKAHGTSKVDGLKATFVMLDEITLGRKNLLPEQRIRNWSGDQNHAVTNETIANLKPIGTAKLVVNERGVARATEYSASCAPTDEQ